MSALAELEREARPEMAKKKKPPEGSLKVERDDAEMIGKLAKMLGLSVAQLFQEKEVREFFANRLIHEMDKEARRLKSDQ